MTPEPHFIGTGSAVADEMIRWIDGGAADSFILGFPVTAEGFDDFARLVLPEMEARGRFDRTQVGRPLRDHLGLPFKPNRHVVRQALAAE